MFVVVAFVAAVVVVVIFVVVAVLFVVVLSVFAVVIACTLSTTHPTRVECYENGLSPFARVVLYYGYSRLVRPRQHFLNAFIYAWLQEKHWAVVSGNNSFIFIFYSYIEIALPN